MSISSDKKNVQTQSSGLLISPYENLHALQLQRPKYSRLKTPMKNSPRLDKLMEGRGEFKPILHWSPSMHSLSSSMKNIRRNISLSYLNIKKQE